MDSLAGWRDRLRSTVVIALGAAACFSAPTPTLSTQMEAPSAGVALRTFLQEHPVRFVPGSVELRTSSLRTLDSLATAFSGLPSTRLVIEGYAYTQSDARLNQELSAYRAEAVRLHLALRGVPPTRLRTYSYGSAGSNGDLLPRPRTELDPHVVIRLEQQ